MVIVVEVMPGADAVSGAVELPVLVLVPEAELELELPLDEHAARVNAAAVATATAAVRRNLWGLLMNYLPFQSVPG